MEILLISTALLLLISTALLLRYLLLKRQLRAFTRSVERHLDSSYNQPVKVECFDRDIVDLANVLNEHIETERRLEAEFVRDKHDMAVIISGISHDFRTPLTASLGYLQMIEKSGELSEKNRGYLTIAYEKNVYLKQLSDDFFEITKLRGNTEPIEKESVNLSALLSELLLEQYEWITENALDAQIDVPEGITVQSDTHCLNRIIGNLLSNAQKYAEHTLEVTLRREEDNVLMRFANGFSGDREVDAENVFEPFYRAESRSKSGSGLGLYVVRRICESLGHEVKASACDGVFAIEIKIVPPRK